MLTLQAMADLIQKEIEASGPDAQFRIGDQIEAGPYLHQDVGGVWRLPDNRGLVVCANDDDLWHDEDGHYTGDGEPAELPLLWKPELKTG